MSDNPVVLSKKAQERRVSAMEFYKESSHYVGPIAKIEEKGFTCDHCRNAETCEWAFDLYNTDGDCIASK